VVAKEFGILPSRVALDLYTDPEQTSLVAYEILSYGRAYAVHKSANAKAMKAYPEQKMLAQVKDIAHDLAEERQRLR
jgi:hypothetical protein